MTETTDPYLAALAAAQEQGASLERAVRDLRALIPQTPAIPRPVALTAARPIQRLEEAGTARSIGVLNPTGIPILWGLAGGSARIDARPISQPPTSLLVLPLFVEDMEIGADPADLAGGDAVVLVLRFATVQPAFLGAA